MKRITLRKGPADKDIHDVEILKTTDITKFKKLKWYKNLYKKTT